MTNARHCARMQKPSPGNLNATAVTRRILPVQKRRTEDVRSSVLFTGEGKERKEKERKEKEREGKGRGNRHH